MTVNIIVPDNFVYANGMGIIHENLGNYAFLADVFSINSNDRGFYVVNSKGAGSQVESIDGLGALLAAHADKVDQVLAARAAEQQRIEDEALQAEQARQAAEAQYQADLPKLRALAALQASDITAQRCFKAGLAFPEEWRLYCNALRVIASTGVGDLPERPEYPDEALPDGTAINLLAIKV